MERLMVTVEEAAECLGVGRSTVYDLMRMGHLGSVKIGRSRRIPIEALHAYIRAASTNTVEVQLV